MSSQSFSSACAPFHTWKVAVSDLHCPSLAFSIQLRNRKVHKNSKMLKVLQSYRGVGGIWVNLISFLDFLHMFHIASYYLQIHVKTLKTK